MRHSIWYRFDRFGRFGHRGFGRFGLVGLVDLVTVDLVDLVKIKRISEPCFRLQSVGSKDPQVRRRTIHAITARTTALSLSHSPLPAAFRPLSVPMRDKHYFPDR